MMVISNCDLNFKLFVILQDKFMLIYKFLPIDILKYLEVYKDIVCEQLKFNLVMGFEILCDLIQCNHYWDILVHN